MGKRLNYWRIGHSDPEDIIWLMDSYNLNQITAGDNSHENLFGKDYENHWRGRYEKSTGFCSIAPPKDETGYKRPPQVLLDILKGRFSVTRFHFFSDGVESFTPNPRGR